MLLLAAMSMLGLQHEPHQAVKIAGRIPGKKKSDGFRRESDLSV
jgi:hypothetical protein